LFLTKNIFYCCGVQLHSPNIYCKPSHKIFSSISLIVSEIKHVGRQMDMTYFACLDSRYSNNS
jgi:hypothetical protein